MEMSNCAYFHTSDGSSSKHLNLIHCIFSFWFKHLEIKKLFIFMQWIEMVLSINNVMSILHGSQKTNRSYCSSITSGTVSYLRLMVEIPWLIGIFVLLLITRLISKRKMMWEYLSTERIDFKEVKFVLIV